MKRAEERVEIFGHYLPPEGGLNVRERNVKVLGTE